MRLIPHELQLRLDGGITTLAHVWRVTRRDGAVFAFTDHDQDLAFDGVIAKAGSGLAPLEIEKTASLAPDVAAAAGALSGDAVTAQDLAAGLWDGAVVTLHRVDWTDARLSMHLFAGRLGEVRTIDGRFTAELRGLKAGLDRSVGRLFARTCDAALGDSRCRVDLTDPEFSSAVCDKTFETCRARFRNAENFRGFPHMPGIDALIAPVSVGSNNDGGSRWTR